MSGSVDSQAGSSDRAGRMREQRRREILAAATEVFARRGYHGASISDVIERAGIARGTFYLYFAGKHEVLDSIFAEAFAVLRARIRPIDVSPGAAPPEVQLRAVLLDVLAYVQGNPDFARLLLSHGLHPDPEVARRVEAFWDDVRDLIAASLERGVAIGLVRPLDIPVSASALLGAVLGVLRHVLAHDATDGIGAVVDDLIGLALRGVGAELPDPRGP